MAMPLPDFKDDLNKLDIEIDWIKDNLKERKEAIELASLLKYWADKIDRMDFE